MPKGEIRSKVQLNRNAGFSLVELLVAVVLLAIIITPLLRLFVTTAHINARSKTTQRATTVAQDIMEGLKAYDIEELKAQFNDPMNGFYVMDSRLIHGTIGEDMVREQAELTYSSNPDQPGVYYFMLESVQFQGGVYDALIRVDATAYEEGNLKSDGVAGGHDTAFNNGQIATPSSVQKGKDGSYVEPYDLNRQVLQDILEHFDLEDAVLAVGGSVGGGGDTEAFSFKLFKELGGSVARRTITLNLTAGSVDADGNIGVNTDVTFDYEVTYGGETYHTCGRSAGGLWVEAIPCGSDIYAGSNLYLFYYPFYDAGDSVKDEIIINNEVHQPFRVYLVKQQDSNPETKLSDVRLNAAEQSYKAVVNVKDASPDNVKIRTNLGVNLVNAAFSGASPAPLAPGQLQTSVVEKQDIPGGQAQYQVNGLLNPDLNVFGLSGTRIQPASGSDDDITEVIFDVRVSVYHEGAMANGFPDTERMVVIEGSKNN